MAERKMSKREELIGRLGSGISAEEAPSLIRAVQIDEALSKAPQHNLCFFGNRRAQQLSDLWFSQRETATIEQKNEVGLAFISRVLGLGDEIARKFAQGDHGAYGSVGEKHSAMPIDTDMSSFWQKIREIFPDFYTDKSINFLVKECGRKAVLHFLEQLEVSLAEKSPVLRSLATNAHAYK